MKAYASIWIGAGNSWVPSSYWKDGSVPNAVGAVADFSTLDILVDRVVNLDGNKTVGAMVFGDVVPSSNWVIGPGGPSNSAL
jgi:hypothetical protein